MSSPIIAGPPHRISGEYIGLREASAQFGIPYSSLRGYVSSGKLPALKSPSRKVWLRAEDVAALFKPVIPEDPKEVS